MSSTLLRLGLWILVIILALYVVHESFEDSPVAELVPLEMLQKALIVGGILLIAGLVFRFLEKGSRKVVKNRCAVCRTPIPHGALYCREHLRRILHDEDDRTHVTRISSGEVSRTRTARPSRPTTSRPR
jgi:predicted nucleic acid-binding Zn ribbon protein